MSKGPDIFNDDNAYKEYLRIKEEAEKNKKIRIDKVLDEYCYTQLNLPQSEYRSHQTDLLYRPKYYQVNVVHPLRENYTSQFIGFNQNSNAQRKRQKALQQQPQQYYYPPANPFLNTGQQSLQQYQDNIIPSLALPQGNLAYHQQSTQNIPYMQQQDQQIMQSKSQFINNCDHIQNRIDYLLKSQLY